MASVLQALLPTSPWSGWARVVLKKCGRPTPLPAPPGPSGLLFNIRTFKPGFSVMGNCFSPLYTFIFNLMLNYLLPLYHSFRIQGEGWERAFLSGFHIIIHNVDIWSLDKFLVILSDGAWSLA